VTVDLNGHSIQGADGTIGISASGRSGVTVKNGTIEGFSTGVGFTDTTSSSVADLHINTSWRGISVSGDISGFMTSGSNRIVGNTISGGRFAGVWLAGSVGDSFVGNKVSGASYGFQMRYTGAMLLESNTAEKNGTGIFIMDRIFGGRSVLRSNNAIGNSGSGIELSLHAATLENNTASHNGGSGIFASDSHGRYINNRTNGNGSIGLGIWDRDESHMVDFAVGGNVSNANGSHGIWVRYPGIVNEGKNRARANGSDDCVNVSCN
jgi:parallel beta-helix repeat protein